MSSTLVQQSAKRAAGGFDLETVARYRRDSLAAAQIYPKANPLLEKPLRRDPPEIPDWLWQRPSSS